MKIVIVGGTHGNEKTGVYLAHKWQTFTERLPAFHDYKICFGNPPAIKENSRYLDFDLNRSFNNSTLTTSEHYESQRSLELKNEVDQWARGAPFFLIDLHTTTSNMGSTCVLSKDDRFTAHVLSCLQKDSPVNILFNSHFDENCIFVDSVAPHGLLIEVGPIAQNVFDSKIIASTENLVFKILDIIHSLEMNPPKDPISLEGYQEFKTVYFPAPDPALLEAIVHPNLIGKDYQPLRPGDPVFQTLKGEPIKNSETELSYPVFINEAAYLEKNIAFLLTKKTQLTF